MYRGGRSTSAAAAGSERQAQFAFLQMPESPVQPLDGSVRLAGSKAKEPHIEVRNRSSKPIRYFEIGWLVKGYPRQGVLGGVNSRWQRPESAAWTDGSGGAEYLSSNLLVGKTSLWQS